MHSTQLGHSTAMTADLQSAGVCILSEAAPQPQVVAASLQAKGLRVRTVSTCVADVLLASASLAMLVIPSADLEPGAATADPHWDRCSDGQQHADGLRWHSLFYTGRGSRNVVSVSQGCSWCRPVAG